MKLTEVNGLEEITEFCLTVEDYKGRVAELSVEDLTGVIEALAFHNSQSIAKVETYLTIHEIHLFVDAVLFPIGKLSNLLYAIMDEDITIEGDIQCNLLYAICVAKAIAIQRS